MSLATKKQAQPIKGLIDKRRIQSRLKQLQSLNVDDYIDEVVMPTLNKKRPGVKRIIEHLEATIVTSQQHGPLYIAEIEMLFSQGKRRIAIIGQDRNSGNGAWLPEHHNHAGDAILRFSSMGLPIVFFIDTPGADAGESANSLNQAHSISRMITASTRASVPTLGVIIGMGYSGGAIPLACTNLLLCVRDGVFNTIQPQGLQSIARKFNLSWQECAKTVGVSPEELINKHCIDGIIDYTPWDQNERRKNLESAIVSAIEHIEASAKQHVSETPSLLQDYQVSLDRYLSPSDYYRALDKTPEAGVPNAQPNIFGLSLRYLRFQTCINRLSSTTVGERSALPLQHTPEGDLDRRIKAEQDQVFKDWTDTPDKIVYDESLSKLWKKFTDKNLQRAKTRGSVTRFLMGDPQDNYGKSRQALLFGVTFFLYNRWKSSARNNLQSLINLLDDSAAIPSTNQWPELTELTVMDIALHQDLRQDFSLQCKNLLIFDALYDTVIENLPSIAKEAMDTKALSKESVEKLLEESLGKVLQSNPGFLNAKAPFEEWLRYFAAHNDRGDLLFKVESWKNIGFPQMNESLFVMLTYFFETLLPEYYSALNGKAFKGHINPVRIGRKKDFWNRLTQGYRDLLIQRLLSANKKTNTPNPDAIIERFFTRFTELDNDKISANPVGFPGFHHSIEAAIAKGSPACGLITGTAELLQPGHVNGQLIRKAGVAISNVSFQAGAFDMASAQKFCHLLDVCAAHNMPLICFISSGGMQTKEGASALFSMAVVNEKITRAVIDHDLAIIMFGFGDCTGGAQASFVTHPLVQTYYFSGCNMPFAGQMVVPSYLPSTATLSNYLSTTNGAMTGLVKHPFADDLDTSLLAIDPNIPTPSLTVTDAIEHAFIKHVPQLDASLEASRGDPRALMAPIRKTLIHARGCTAVKLIRKAHENNVQVVLVASDPDMNAVPAKMLKGRDQLVCIGGNSSDESYLNAHSILKVAEYEQVDSLHPGIGFLSENPDFANLCVNSGINFIGPSANSMLTMGNKSNAVKTAIASGVPVVPGSHSILQSPDHAVAIAAEIGYPVLLKAVHGGGGKGIKVVHSASDMHKFYTMVSTEARAAFGSGDLYLEKFVTSMRHIEVQILRDSHGNTSILGLRDCTVQRNNQKVIEESGSTMLPDDLRQAVITYSRLLANAVDYIGAGTVEYIYDLTNNCTYFMEMNTRLQVEHPVTEATSGVDIVKSQFEIASGGTIEEIPTREIGYAVEVRVTAEKLVTDSDGNLQITPNPGRITRCQIPANASVEIISIADTGIDISPYYDSLIAQIIYRGESRAEVIDKLYDYLDSIVIEGICTNIPLLKRILKDATFRKGNYDTHYLPGFLSMLDAESLIAETDAAARSSDSAQGNSSIRVDNSRELKVFAASSGIFYTANSPADPDFVKPGDIVQTSDTLALVEAMKMFSQLSLDNYNKAELELYPSNTKYRVEHRNIANGQPVSAGDLLFIISPVEE